MTDAQLRAMILALLGEADYDLAKHFDPELSEDPDAAEEQMQRMIDIARRAVEAP